MNDYWNDPPDYPEPPECCGEVMEVLDSGVCQCHYCGGRLEPAGPEPECAGPGIEDMAVGEEIPDKCQHGNAWGECGACDHEGDLAFDAARERRMR